MCNAYNHDPWCPCGWGPVHKYFNEMSKKVICKIFDPYKPALKRLFEIAQKPVNDIYNEVYKKYCQFFDKSNQYYKDSDLHKAEIKPAAEKREQIAKLEKELSDKKKPLTEAERQKKEKEIEKIKSDIDKILKSKPLKTKTGKEITSFSEYEEYYGLRPMKDFYEKVGMCDGFVRDKMLRDAFGIDLKKLAGDNKVVGVKPFFDYCRNIRTDSEMNEKLYTWKAKGEKAKENNDEKGLMEAKKGFAGELVNMVFPGSIIFVKGEGGGKNRLHVGIVKEVHYKDGGVVKIVFMHASSGGIGKGIKEWPLRSFREKDVQGKNKNEPKDIFTSADWHSYKIKEQDIKFRRLYISNIALHRKLN